MNWPFSKPVVKQTVVPRIVQKDFEKEENKIQQFEGINKKFYKDVKRYIEAIDETNKSESKLINNILNVMATTTSAATPVGTLTAASANKLTNSISIPTLTSSSASLANRASVTSDTFNNKVSLWKQMHQTQNQNYLEKLKFTCQYDVIEPMKKLNLIFPNVYSAIKRREQAYNELEKHQNKLQKLQERERTGGNLVKINQQQNNVTNARIQFQKEHLLLMEELPKLYDSRINYIYPCIQQLIKSQIDFFSNYSTNYEKLLDDCNFNQIYNLSNTSTSTASSTTSSSRSISSILSNTINQQTNEQQHQQEQDKNQNKISDEEAVNQADNDIKRLLDEIKSLSIVASD